MRFLTEIIHIQVAGIQDEEKRVIRCPMLRMKMAKRGWLRSQSISLN